MSQTTVETIIEAINDEMKSFIQVSRGYRTTPTAIYKGAFSPDEVQSFPVIGFDVVAEDFDDIYQGPDDTAWIEFDIYGYSYSDGIDRISDIRNLAHDVLKFLHNDFSLTGDVQILGKLEYSGYPARYPGQ